MTRIHFIAIGGSIMHSLAIDMYNKGYAVTGSDDEIYEPSRSRLLKHGLLPPATGWRPDFLDESIDLVVLGMHARADNPELIRAKELGLKVWSFPEFVFHLTKDKTRIVIAGSHGKTTTSGMIAHVLHKAGIPADRMIGASIGELSPVTFSDADIVVLEGDEYLSSPDDPRPKFLHYHPQITVITGIAWDHMNVFPTYRSYIEPFEKLIRSLSAKDMLIFCKDDSDLEDLVRNVSPSCMLVPYTSHPHTVKDGIVFLSDGKTQFPLRIFGIHNMQNLAAAHQVCKLLGVPDDTFYRAMVTFEGAAKRLQLLYQTPALTSYLDFAHAPSKVKATVQAVRSKHKDAFVIAILELHTYSSLNPKFLPQYKNALQDADAKVICYSPHTLEMKKLPDLSPELLSEFFAEERLHIALSGAELERLILNLPMGKKNVLLWMSSGRFDGLEIRQISEACARNIDSD